jgi:hypothetical protein
MAPNLFKRGPDRLSWVTEISPDAIRTNTCMSNAYDALLAKRMHEGVEFNRLQLDALITTIQPQTTAELFNCLHNAFEDQSFWSFRGHSNAGWTLTPVLERICRAHDLSQRGAERYVCEEFLKHISLYDKHPPSGMSVDLLALMQHFGAPTRLLDVTRSPYVALFFAVAEQEADWSCLWAFPTKYFLLDDRTQCAVGPIDNDVDGAIEAACLDTSDTGPFIIFPAKPTRANERSAVQQGEFLITANPAPFENSLQGSRQTAVRR